MKYCYRCGAAMDENDRFCSRCGADSFSGGATWQKSPEVQKEPPGKLGLELAYAGTLFWVPLLICPREKNAKFCANQGLWVLILSVIACMALRLLSTKTQKAAPRDSASIPICPEPAKRSRKRLPSISN